MYFMKIRREDVQPGQVFQMGTGSHAMRFRAVSTLRDLDQLTSVALNKQDDFGFVPKVTYGTRGTVVYVETPDRRVRTSDRRCGQDRRSQ